MQLKASGLVRLLVSVARLGCSFALSRFQKRNEIVTLIVIEFVSVRPTYPTQTSACVPPPSLRKILKGPPDTSPSGGSAYVRRAPMGLRLIALTTKFIEDVTDEE